MEISSLPEWAQPGFKGMKALNRIQSRVCDCALYSSEVGDGRVWHTHPVVVRARLAGLP